MHPLDAWRFTLVKRPFQSKQRDVTSWNRYPALRSKSGVCVAKWPILTYNGAARVLGRLSLRPYRAGPPTPTQSSAMVLSPAAPTAGLCFPCPSRIDATDRINWDPLKLPTGLRFALPARPGRRQAG